MEKINLKPKQWVLVRGSKSEEWTLSRFSHYDKNKHPVCINSFTWNRTIPYEGNEHLLGTTDDYKEPYVPEDGDFVAIEVYEGVVSGTYPWICIFKSISGSIDAYTGLGLDGHLINKGNGANYNKDWMKHIRPATESEKQQLLDALHKEGKDWDAEKKEIVEYKWKPVDGEEYHYCKYNDELNEFEVETTKWHALYTDTNRRKANNCFKEFIECSNACDRMNETFKELLKGDQTR